MLHFTFSVVVLQKPCYSTPSWRPGLRMGWSLEDGERGGAYEWVKKKLRLSLSDVFRFFYDLFHEKRTLYRVQHKSLPATHNKDAQTFQWCTECLRFGISTVGHVRSVPYGDGIFLASYSKWLRFTILAHYMNGDGWDEIRRHHTVVAWTELLWCTSKLARRRDPPRFDACVVI